MKCVRLVMLIAVHEQKSLFNTPIAWVLSSVFVIQTSTNYISRLLRAVSLRDQGHLDTSVTNDIFSDLVSGVLIGVSGSLYLYIPLMTMGLIARELSVGSIKLIETSPISVSAFILGKYVAGCLFVILLTSYVLILAVVSSAFIDRFDFQLVASGMLGILLVGAAYVAVGLYMSSLSSHQVVAALLTFASLSALQSIGLVAQSVPLLGDAAYWLAISGRVEHLVSGLISTKDILYFGLVAVLFLFLTYLRMNGPRIGSVFRRTLLHSGVVAVACGFGVVFSHPQMTYHLDITRDQRNSLSNQSMNVVEELDGPVEITAYVNILDGYWYRFHHSRRNWLFDYLFSKYYRYYHNIDIDYQYYYGPSPNDKLRQRYPDLTIDQIARKFAEDRGIRLSTIMTPTEVADVCLPCVDDFRPKLLLRYNNKESALRMYDDLLYYPSEPQISAALGWVQRGPVRLGVIEGNDSPTAFGRGILDWSIAFSDVGVRGSLVNNGFDVKSLSPDSNLSSYEMIILPIGMQITDQILQSKLSMFVRNGGDVLFLFEGEPSPVEFDMLSEFGVEIRSRSAAPTNGKGASTDIVSSVLNHGGLQSEISLSVDSQYYLEVSDGTVDLQWTLSVAPTVHSPGTTEVDLYYGLGFGSQIEGRGRVAIVAGSGVFANGNLSRSDTHTGNKELRDFLFRWLTGGRYPIQTASQLADDTTLDLNLRQARQVRFLFVYSLPTLLILCGAGLLVGRARR